MKQPRIQGRYVSWRQAEAYRQKFEAIHGELRAELKPLRVENGPFPIASFLSGLAVLALIAMVAR